MSTFTPNKNLEMPARNAYVNTWDVPLNAVISEVDTALGGNTQISVTGIGAGTYTLSVAQYTPPNIVFQGTLGASLVYQVPSGVGGIWSVLNSAAGAFTLQLAVTGGSSVVLPPGRRVLLISDGFNMQFAQTGGSTPANPSVTVGLTAKNGTAATFMTSDSAPALDVTISPFWSGVHNFAGHVAFGLASTVAVFDSLTIQNGATLDATAGANLVATQTAGDNSTNAASTAFVATSFAPLASPAFSGTPTAPTAAGGTSTTQLATTAFVATSFAPKASPALTGTPTTPTAAASTNTTQIASTAMVQAAIAAAGSVSLLGNGYAVFSSGLIIQWGINTFNASGTTFINYPIAFPTACLTAIANAYGAAATSYVLSFSATQINVVNGAGTQSSWIAIGH